MKKITLSLYILSYSLHLFGQIPYGNNPAAGKFVQTKNARIYYEVYGKGEPLLLIHGSLYGYIDEFALIPDSRLLIVPESGHVAVLLNRSIYLDYAIPFFKNK